MNLQIIVLNERRQIKKSMFHLYKIRENVNCSKLTANLQLSGGTNKQVHSLDCGDGFTSIYVYQNLPNYILLNRC